MNTGPISCRARLSQVDIIRARSPSRDLIHGYLCHLVATCSRRHVADALVQPRWRTRRTGSHNWLALSEKEYGNIILSLNRFVRAVAAIVCFTAPMQRVLNRVYDSRNGKGDHLSRQNARPNRSRIRFQLERDRSWPSPLKILLATRLSCLLHLLKSHFQAQALQCELINRVTWTMLEQSIEISIYKITYDLV